MKNSLLLVEYEIAITNTGEIAGYAKLISNSIPEGMVFNSELNTNWYEENDGKIYSVALENNLIQPGETVILKLVLTREITNNTSLEFTSKATLERTFNEYLIDDKDEKNNSSNADLTVSTNGRRK